MPLLRIGESFDDEDFVYEWKIDGFRGLAFIGNGECRLVSRNGYTFRRWNPLKREITRSIRSRSAILDGEIACLDPDGRSNFNALLFNRGTPFFCAFDVLVIDADDVRGVPLLERKRRLLEIMPRVESRVRYVDHVHGT